MSTKERLAQDLREAGAPQALVRQALDGVYDDYESLSATPIVDLVRALERAGLRAMAQQARNGAYDGSREEADAWMQREGWNLLGEEPR